jgi:ankyrin repeat protein
MSTNSKKVEENSYTDSGFHSGFQESCEISRELNTADKVDVDMSTKEGNSQDSENFTDSGIIESGIIISEPQVVPSQFVPDCFNPSFKRHPQHPKVDLYFEQDEDGYTKLHIAVLQNLPSAIHNLTQLVPDASYLNIRNYFGQTPLHLAVLEDQHETVKKLITAGADVNIRDNRCNTPLHLAVSNGSRRCAETILSAINPQGKLLANLEQWNYEGETCFFLASKARDLFMMRLLVANGADVNAREGRSGYTSLHMAVESKAAEVIKFLCEDCKSLNIDTENYAGLTSFQLSLLTCQDKLAEYLMSKGATPYFTSEDSDMEDSDGDSDYNDEIEKNQIISKIAEIAVN